MQKTFLQQWKSILGIVLLAATSLAYIFGAIDEKTAAAAGSVVGAFTGVSLALKLNRIENGQ